MAGTASLRRSYDGPAILSYGFRPFFLGAAAWAVLAVGLWLPLLNGEIALPSGLSPIEWHTHELVFGYVPAVVAGFLLTAVPNWTGRLPVMGHRLLGLVLTWIAGRIAMLMSASIGLPLAAIIDLGFLIALGSVAAREIVAGENYRNLRVLVGIGLLLAGNALFHAEVLWGWGSGHGVRLGIAAALLLIMLIGGRIIPSFTRNWLVRQGAGRLPAAFGRYDGVTIVVSGLTLAAWIARPDWQGTALLAVLAGGLHIVRLARWATERTIAEPLVLSLHLGYAFIPIGFLLLAGAILAPDVLVPTGALHGWTIGAIGLMTLAVMTRASLGHTGRDLVDTAPILFIYSCVLLAALARIAAAFGLYRDALLHVSAGSWVLGFAAFCIVFGPMLVTKRGP